MAGESVEVRRVAQDDLQRIFNEADYWGKVQRGEFYAFIKRCGPATNGPKDAVRSQSIFYFDRNHVRMARVHWYLRADNSIAAGGKPDPKQVYLDGVLYRMHKGGG